MGLVCLAIPVVLVAGALLITVDWTPFFAALPLVPQWLAIGIIASSMVESYRSWFWSMRIAICLDACTEPVGRTVIQDNAYSNFLWQVRSAAFLVAGFVALLISPSPVVGAVRLWLGGYKAAAFATFLILLMLGFAWVFRTISAFCARDWTEPLRPEVARKLSKMVRRYEDAGIYSTVAAYLMFAGAVFTTALTAAGVHAH
jgi:hypothetical protein